MVSPRVFRATTSRCDAPCLRLASRFVSSTKRESSRDSLSTSATVRGTAVRSCEPEDTTSLYDVVQPGHYAFTTLSCNCRARELLRARANHERRMIAAKRSRYRIGMSIPRYTVAGETPLKFLSSERKTDIALARGARR